MQTLGLYCFDLTLNIKVMLNTAAVTFQFGPNLTGSFMGQAFTGDKCHEDICTGNVCLGHTFYSSHFDTGKQQETNQWGLALMELIILPR